MIRRATVAAVLLATLWAGCKRQEEPSIATVNGTRIPASAFRERFAHYLASTSAPDNIQARKQIAQNLINEVLIAEELHRSGADRDSAYLRGLDLIHRQAILDGYARRMTTDTLHVSEAQVLAEFRRFNTKVTARYVYAATEAEARTLRARLTAGEPFERVARDVFNDPGLANNGGSLGTFGWGEMEEPLEETAFTLPVGELSEPVRLSMGYAIVRVDHRNLVNPLASETDFAKVKQKLGDAIRARTIPRLLREHARQIAQSMEPQFDDATLAAVYAEWPVLSGEGNAVPVSEQLPPPSPDLRARNLVRLRGTWWTVGTLVERLAETKERQRRRVKNVEDLREVILGLAAREEVFSRALKDGIDRDSTVIAQEKNLATEVRLRHWAAMVQDTVGRGGWPDSLLRHEYERNKHTLQDPPMVNVAEVLVRTEQEAADVARRVRGGADFAGTARARSIRLWAARRGGELGFNTRAGFGILGEKFFQARPGTILGPERVEPYWGVFKILARKEGRQKSFEASRETLVRGVEAAAKQQAFQASLSALRERAQISLDVEALARVDLHSETK